MVRNLSSAFESWYRWIVGVEVTADVVAITIVVAVVQSNIALNLLANK